MVLLKVLQVLKKKKMNDFLKKIQDWIISLLFVAISSACAYFYSAHKKIEQMPIEDLKKEIVKVKEECVAEIVKVKEESVAENEKLQMQIKDLEEQIHGGDKVERGIKSVLRGLETKTHTLELLFNEEKRSRVGNNETIYKQIEKCSEKINQISKEVYYLKGRIK